MIAIMRRIFGAVAASLALAACGTAGGERGASATLAGPSARAYAHVVVSVADMQQALGLWEERFGMEISRRDQGGDAGLARIWGLADDAIAEQALLNTPGLIDGGVHLVRFTRPGEPVRAQTDGRDLGPQGLVLAVDDLAARGAELRAASGPEGLELLLRERRGKPEVLSSTGYGVALQMLATVADIEREAAFFHEVIGLEVLSAGPTMRVLGARNSQFGRIELAQATAAGGRDLYARAVPPARGLLSV